MQKSNMGDFHKSSVLFAKIRLVFEPVANSLVVPVKSEDSPLALIKFGKFIFSPGMGVLLVEVIILFVCQFVIFCHEWGDAALHPSPVVSCHLLLHYLDTYYSSFMLIEAADVWGDHTLNSAFFSPPWLKLGSSQNTCLRREDMCKRDILKRDVQAMKERNAWLLQRGSADNTCRGCISVLVLPRLFSVDAADWVSSCVVI